MANRVGVVSRKTNETDIQMELNLDGSGYAKVDTGIGFFDHMLISFAKHGFFDLNCKVTGDLFVDSHHTIEDTGIVLGQAIAKAVGDKQGIKRFGSFMLPMDETLVLSALDLSGRPYLVYDLDLSTPQVGYFDTQMVKEFFYAVSYSAMMNLHIKQPPAKICQCLFSLCVPAFPFAKALDEATQYDSRLSGQVLSTKGSL